MICFSSYTDKNNAILGLAGDAMVLALHHLHDKVFAGIGGLCVMLRHLAYPSGLCNMEEMFGRGASELGLIFKP